MKKRGMGYVREQRNRAIARKLRILKDVRYFDNCEGFNVFVNNPVAVGGLDKGKIHCSCGMCAEKTRNVGWKHSDKRKLEKENDE